MFCSGLKAWNAIFILEVVMQMIPALRSLEDKSLLDGILKLEGALIGAVTLWIGLSFVLPVSNYKCRPLKDHAKESVIVKALQVPWSIHSCYIWVNTHLFCDLYNTYRYSTI